MVMPIGMLMMEHRLIERMIALMKKEVERIKKEKIVNFEFIEKAVDFIRTYADRLHHGKEEKILFRELKAKKLDEQHRKMMEELIEEHRWGRKKVKELVDASQKYKEGNGRAIPTILGCLEELVQFYPQHIKKEDKHFFIPIMSYLNQTEQESMLEEEREFDRNFIHEIYKEKVEEVKKSID
jgi:hemerythrin-like domain-containing protein